jgi:hypothetical protein
MQILHVVGASPRYVARQGQMDGGCTGGCVEGLAIRVVQEIGAECPLWPTGNHCSRVHYNVRNLIHCTVISSLLTLQLWLASTKTKQSFFVGTQKQIRMLLYSSELFKLESCKTANASIVPVGHRQNVVFYFISFTLINVKLRIVEYIILSSFLFALTSEICIKCPRSAVH